MLNIAENADIHVVPINFVSMANVNVIITNGIVVVIVSISRLITQIAVNATINVAQDKFVLVDAVV